MGLAMDRQTFDRLVLDHLVAAQRFAIRLTGDPHAAEDLVQDALLKAHRNWQSFRGESRFTTWLFRIVINCFRDRVARPAEPIGDDAPDRPGRDPATEAAAKELGEIVAGEVSRLPPRQREVIVLIVYEQMSIAEAAGVLEISQQNVRTTLHLARQRLRVRLSPHFAGDRR
jgi:RNA polymerase sigma-70 factor (ECF subfamily)